MKKLLSLSLLLVLTVTLMAQAPKMFMYQAVVRDASGNLVKSNPVGLKASILKESVEGSAVYSEIHAKNTNENGLLSLEIGSGTVAEGDFATIDWAQGPYFMKIEIDIKGGSEYTLTTTQQLLSVPYALYAGNGFSGNYEDLNNKPTIPTTTSELNNNSGFITKAEIPAQVNADWNASTGAAKILNKPTNVSVFANDAKYVTEAQLLNKIAKLQEQIDTLFNRIGLPINHDDDDDDTIVTPPIEKACGELTVTYNDYEYGTVQVGEQCWLKENLQTTKYADGTEIDLGGSSASEMDGYYYYPNDSKANQKQYGLLYNWAALMYNAEKSETNPSGVRSLCPEGWHIPSMAEFQQFKSAINTSEYQCEGDNSTVKAICSNTGWTKSDVKCLPGYEQETANNATGFSAMPAGKFSNERYLQFSQGASFWTSSYWDLVDSPIQSHIYEGINFLYVGQDDTANKTDAMSVRCLRN